MLATSTTAMTLLFAIAVLPACRTVTEAPSPWPVNVNDCSAGGSVTFHHADGTVEPRTFDTCQVFPYGPHDAIAKDGVPGHGLIEAYTRNTGGWEFGNPVSFFVSLEAAGYTGPLVTAFQSDDQAVGTVAIGYRNNDHPARVEFNVAEGQSFILSSPLYSEKAPDFTTTTLTATALAVVGGGTLDFQIPVEVTTSENFCKPYAENVVQLATQKQCQGAGMDAKAFEQQCNVFVSQYVRAVNCSGAYSRYLECASNADACNPCRSEYCAFNTCMCRTYPVGAACLATCF